MSDSEDDIKLSASSLAALNEFLSEETERKAQFDKLISQAEADYDGRETLEDNEPPQGIDLFTEDWGLSQFWYSDKTAEVLARELFDDASDSTGIVIVSAPSVYAMLKKLVHAEAVQRPELKARFLNNVYLLEFDTRFKLLAGSKFVHYDFARPMELPKELKGKFDRVLIDPPFLSVDCQTKAAVTARWLLNPQHSSQYKVVICTGERMKDVIKKVYPDTHMTTFYPEHGNGLSNEFRCYATYEGPNWKFQ